MELSFDEGSYLIIAGLPSGTDFGIDLCSYKVDGHFRGIKAIPVGPHYVYCAAKGLYGDLAPRTGFLHYFKPKEILIREWSCENEELRERQISDPKLEEQKIRDNLKDLDRYLTPYDFTGFHIWRSLTDTIISESCLGKYIGKEGSDSTSLTKSDNDDDDVKNKFDINKLPSRSVILDDEFFDLKIPREVDHFCKIPDRIPKNVVASDISKHYLDCLAAIIKLMENFTNPNELLIEIQISFILFIVGHSMKSFSHWCKILNLLSNSETAVVRYHCFYIKYLKILSRQLPYLPDELVEQNHKNIVYKDIKNILINAAQSGLRASADELIKDLDNTMKWKFTDLFEEDPEDLPVIVDVNSL